MARDQITGAPDGRFGLPPGAALSAMPGVGHEVERVLRANGCCYDVPASTRTGAFGSGFSNRQFTRDATDPLAI